MTTGLRVGIAGYGATGKIRRKHIDRHSAFRTVAVCDRDFEHANEMADGVRATNRVGLAEQIVAQPDLRIRVGAADLLECRTGPSPHLIGGDAEQ